jgi:hypothetical protein
VEQGKLEEAQHNASTRHAWCISQCVLCLAPHRSPGQCTVESHTVRMIACVGMRGSGTGLWVQCSYCRPQPPLPADLTPYLNRHPGGSWLINLAIKVGTEALPQLHSQLWHGACQLAGADLTSEAQGCLLGAVIHTRDSRDVS